MASRARPARAWHRPRALLLPAATLVAVAALHAIAGHEGAAGTAHKAAAQAPIALQAEPGDLVFRLGRSVWSPYFGLLNSHSGFSHVGVVVEASPGRLSVIHAEADDDGRNGFVKLTPLQAFIADAVTYEIKRNQMPPPQKQGFVSATLRHWLNGTAFDDSFTLADRGERVYCSELVWVASQAVAGPALGAVEVIAGREIVSVDSIYRSPLLR